ncbi:hypothetical protein J4233_03515 [Candidatus Pacearchaeota archaeon]|nr:hypothetical protein [Candidatus Pacearchaeota archaeon]
MKKLVILSIVLFLAVLPLAAAQENFACLDFCGDAGCQQDICQGQEGCPCYETTESCPQDCIIQGENQSDSSGESFVFGNYFWIGLSVVGAVLFLLIGLKLLRWMFWILALIMIALAAVFWFVL